MNSGHNKTRVLVWTLILIAIHSATVGIALLTNPYDIIEFFNLHSDNKFFPTQNGIFHIVMAVIYLTAASDIYKNNTLINLIIVIKLIATIYLSIYFSFVEQKIIILISAIVDFIMAIRVLYLFRKIKDETGSSTVN
jgi:hypothetical protein